MNRKPHPASRRRIYICTACLVLWVLFIWGNSLQPATISGAQSSVVTAFITQWFPRLTEHIVRKTAHFTEYTVLGFLLSTFFFLALGGNRKNLSLVLFMGILIPLLDETIQLFIPGRAGAVQDVLLDCSGVLFGLTIGWLLRLPFRRSRHTT